ncbi:MAG: 2-dehydro-3-deoxyphosphooctonate aldolase [Akkermansia sp.]|nr:2-dehydro-3-deoxyphosphooctonate aldolase [Akkermansia sp.]
MMKRTLLLAAACLAMSLPSCTPDEPDRVAIAYRHVKPAWGAHFGKPVFIRIIKEKRELELHVREEEENSWHLLKTYPIAAMSGTLGPKQAEGDLQAPEGFYEVYPSSLNPRSNHWLAFNVGYPNAYDRSLGRTGSYIMVHGGASSVGCFAITDPAIEEVYTMVHQALEAGQKYVPVQIYPFEMTPQRMQNEQDSPHHEFWQYLQPGWQFTHEHAAPYQPER